MTEGEKSKPLFWVFNLTWLVLPMAMLIGFDVAYRKYGPQIADADQSLLFYEIALFVGVVIFATLFGRKKIGAWGAPRGWFWLVVAGPLLLPIITPLPLALDAAKSSADMLPAWFALSLLVAFNEETIFRGFMLQGLARGNKPFAAVVISSLGFGLLHFLNMSAEASILFVSAQMLAAFGVGTILAAVTLRSGSLLPAFLLHFLGDFVGLTALGGYGEAIQNDEIAFSLAITGMAFAIWGIFWSWRIICSGKISIEAR